MIAQLQSIAHKVEVGPPPTQRQMKKTYDSPPPLARKQIQAVAKKIRSGQLKLPDLTFSSDDEYEAVWALLDKGSSVHVLDASKHLPGARTQKPAHGAKGFETANGGGQGSWHCFNPDHAREWLASEG